MVRKSVFWAKSLKYNFLANTEVCMRTKRAENLNRTKQGGGGGFTGTQILQPVSSVWSPHCSHFASGRGRKEPGNLRRYSRMTSTATLFQKGNKGLCLLFLRALLPNHFFCIATKHRVQGGVVANKKCPALISLGMLAFFSHFLASKSFREK